MKQNASHKPRTLKIISSIMVTAFFIGALLPSAIAGRINEQPSVSVMDLSGCCTYMVEVEYVQTTGSCSSCKEAVKFAIDYMIDHVKENVKGIYFLQTVDVSLLIFHGLIEGFIKSGYQMDIDPDDLETVIDYWVDKLTGPQIFTVTKFLAVFGSIAIGVTDYLLNLCNGNNTIASYPTNYQNSRPLFKIWTLVLQLLGTLK